MKTSLNSFGQHNITIGVGTSNPDSKRRVLGQIRASTMANGSGTESLPAYRFQDDLNTGMWLDGTGELAISTATSEAMRIDVNGDVGIGVTNPLANLHVNGEVRADGGFISADQTIDVPDYVFQKYFLGKSELKNDYSFETLEAIENFIKKNHHLPAEHFSYYC